MNLVAHTAALAEVGFWFPAAFGRSGPGGMHTGVSYILLQPRNGGFTESNQKGRIRAQPARGVYWVQVERAEHSQKPFYHFNSLSSNRGFDGFRNLHSFKPSNP